MLFGLVSVTRHPGTYISIVHLLTLFNISNRSVYVKIQMYYANNNILPNVYGNFYS